MRANAAAGTLHESDDISPKGKTRVGLQETRLGVAK